MIGTKRAHDEITGHLGYLGSGGMGDVYQATDSRLGRSAAIKLLPAAFASGPERLARFRREAQLLASLNPPSVAHIYGVEESGDTRCIVMELIEGQTLQARIRKGSIPVDEALGIALNAQPQAARANRCNSNDVGARLGGCNFVRRFAQHFERGHLQCHRCRRHVSRPERIRAQQRENAKLRYSGSR